MLGAVREYKSPRPSRAGEYRLAVTYYGCFRLPAPRAVPLGDKPD